MSNRETINIISASETVFAVYDCRNSPSGENIILMVKVPYFAVVKYEYGLVLEPITYDGDLAMYDETADVGNYKGLARDSAEAKALLDVDNNTEIKVFN